MGTKEAKVTFKADTSELNQEINRSESQLKTFRSELKLNETQLKGTGDSSKLLEQRLSILSNEMAEAKNKTALVEEKLAKAKEIFGDNSEEVASLTRQLNACKNTEASIQNEINATNKKLEQHEDAWEDSGDAAKGAGEDFDDSGQRAVNAVENIGKAILAAGIVNKVKDIGMECIESAADLQASESQFAQVFGEMSTSASDALTSISDSAGISETRIRDSFTKIAAFAKTTGMDTESALGLADRAMVAVSDSAAFYDRSLEETTESLQSFLKGNYENDAALGLSCTEVTRNAAANKLYGVSFQDLSESQKQLTLLQMVEDANAASGALGQAARESDTWTNQTGNLQQAWEDLQGVIGSNILPTAVDIVKGLADAIQSISDKIPAAIEWFDQYSWVIGLVALVIGTVVAGIGLYNAVQGIKTAMNAAETASLGGLIAAQLACAASTIAAVAPYILIVAAIVAVIAIAVLLVKNWDTVKEEAQKLWEKIKEVWENIKSSILEKAEEIKTSFGSIWNGIENTVTRVINTVKSTISSGLQAAFATVSNVLNSIKGKFSNVFEEAKNIVKTAIDTIKGFFNFSWRLPELKMPHINIKGKFSISPPEVPKFSVKWNKEGAIFTKPTIVGRLGSVWQGVGEAGMEAVMPIEKLQRFFDNAIERAANLQINTDVISDIVYLLQVIANKDSNLYINGRRMSEETAGDYDEVNGTRLALRERGLAM